MALPNARDQQILRESLDQFDPKARDQEIIREALARYNANAVDLQIFREALIILTPAATALMCMVYADYQRRRTRMNLHSTVVESLFPIARQRRQPNVFVVT